jgi:hypothetical protein
MKKTRFPEFGSDPGKAAIIVRALHGLNVLLILLF